MVMRSVSEVDAGIESMSFGPTVMPCSASRAPTDGAVDSIESLLPARIRVTLLAVRTVSAVGVSGNVSAAGSDE
jgi:hypothetical protein